MANFKSNLCQVSAGYRPAIIPSQAGEVIARRGVVTLPNTFGDNDIAEMVPLPAGCVPVDVIVDCGDLDGATALVFDVGVVNAAGDDLVAGTNFMTGLTTGQAGGIARMTDLTGARLASDPDTHRNIGIKVTTPAGTPAQGVVGLTLLYRAADQGE
jgi:hypothetical protein